MLLDLSEISGLRKKEAQQNPLFDPKSKKWVASVIQDFEICVIRQDFQHGFISLGWGDFDRKIILYSKDQNEDQKKKYQRYIWNKMESLSEAMAKHLNKLEEN